MSTKKEIEEEDQSPRKKSFHHVKCLQCTKEFMIDGNIRLRDNDPETYLCEYCQLKYCRRCKTHLKPNPDSDFYKYSHDYFMKSDMFMNGHHIGKASNWGNFLCDTCYNECFYCKKKIVLSDHGEQCNRESYMTNGPCCEDCNIKYYSCGYCKKSIRMIEEKNDRDEMLWIRYPYLCINCACKLISIGYRTVKKELKEGNKEMNMEDDRYGIEWTDEDKDFLKKTYMGRKFTSIDLE